VAQEDKFLAQNHKLPPARLYLRAPSAPMTRAIRFRKLTFIQHKEIVMRNGSSKKRVWTLANVRNLKSLARKKCLLEQLRAV
jgi:hypothetical protein